VAFKSERSEKNKSKIKEKRRKEKKKKFKPMGCLPLSACFESIA